MLLHDLLRQYDPAIPLGAVPNLEILGVQEDSRLVHRGDLFISRPSFNPTQVKTEARRFVADACARGASAIVTTDNIDGAISIPQIVLKDPAAVSILAHVYHGRPSKRMSVLGVTGTNGKTTTAYLIRHILNKAKHRCGMIGTVEIDDGKTRSEATMTTPGAVELASLIARMRENGCQACAMETSSHALDQKRAAGVQFAGAGFTNLTGDHLDYHGSMESYAAAKAELFTSLDPQAVAVINSGDPWAGRMIRDCSARVIRFAVGIDGQNTADYSARDISITSKGTHFALHTPDGQAMVSMKLIGRHNIENALCAAALVGETFKLPVHQTAAALHDAGGAPGRLQAVCCEQSFAVLVDYAHTDDALENVLSALRPLTRGKLRVVFGCGGDRDRSKRPRMAATANRLADAVYITSDNPRTEDPRNILNEITTGLPASNKCVMIEIDRRAAIERALQDAERNDVVLVAGKGHENYQIIGMTKHHFDDVEECERVLRLRVACAQ